MMTNWTKRVVTGLAAVAVMATSVAASALDFVPFENVENVCPKCEQPKADVIALGTGETIRGTVVAENDDFFVVVRNGEVRGIPQGDVQAIEWASGSQPSGLSDKDQIVLKNGHVFSGTIVDDKDEPSFYQIESSFSDYTYTVFKDQVESVYKGGDLQ